MMRRVGFRRSNRSGRGGSTSNILALISAGLAILGLLVIVLYAVATPGASGRYLGVGVLTAIAALATGCLLGFLFGIPKVVSSGELRHRKSAPTEVVRTRTQDTTVTTATIPPSSSQSTSIDSAADQGDGAAREAEAAAAGTSQHGATGAEPGSASSFEPSTNLSEVSDWLTKLLLGAGLVELTHLGAPLGKLIDSVALGLSQASATGSLDGTAQVVAGSLLITYFVLGFLDGYVVTTLWYGSEVRGL